jgi:hypothetical protein
MDMIDVAVMFTPVYAARVEINECDTAAVANTPDR